MKLVAINLLSLAAIATAFPSFRTRQADDSLPTGEWIAAGPNDVRGPCPAMNTLANHGYLPRDGKGYTFSMMTSALLKHYGAGVDLTAGLAGGALTLKNDTIDQDDSPFFFHGIKSQFGMRDPGQVNTDGQACIDLDQLSLHGAVEHDVSLVHADFNQGDNHNVVPELVNELVAASSDGTYLTMHDFLALRTTRLEEQKAVNPDLVFGKRENVFAYGELSLIMGVFGDRLHNGRIDVEVLRTYMGEQRLPIAEGWSKKFLPVTLVELNVYMAALTALTAISK